MRSLIGLTTAFVTLLAAVPAPAADIDTAAFDGLIDDAVKAFDVPGAAVAVVKDDRLVYARGFGVRKLGGDDKVTPDTVFAIASCTKAFTAAAVGSLVAERKMSWDDPVRKHLDFFRLADATADREVTLRDLLCHRTGMPRHDWLWLVEPDNETYVRAYGRARPASSFRSTWEYANVPFTTAGLAAGRVADTDWPTLMRKRFFEPLKMTHACCTGREAEAMPDFAAPHYRDLAGKVQPIARGRIDSARGAGSINASVHDMANWMRFQLADGSFEGKRLMPAEVLRETRTAQMVVRHEGRWKVFFPPDATHHLSYGLGWFVHDHRGRSVVSHGGTGDGFRAQTWLAPDEKLGVVVFGSVTPSLFPEAVSKAVLDHMLGLTPRDWIDFYRRAEAKQDEELTEQRKKRADARKPDTKPSRELKVFAGTYEEPAYGKAEVRSGDDGLSVRWGGLTFRLEHYHFDAWTATLSAPVEDARLAERMTLEAQFRLAANGDVESLRFLDQEFRRLPTAK